MQLELIRNFLFEVNKNNVPWITGIFNRYYIFDPFSQTVINIIGKSPCSQYRLACYKNYSLTLYTNHPPTKLQSDTTHKLQNNSTKVRYLPMFLYWNDWLNDWLGIPPRCMSEPRLPRSRGLQRKHSNIFPTTTIDSCTAISSQMPSD